MTGWRKGAALFLVLLLLPALALGEASLHYQLTPLGENLLQVEMDFSGAEGGLLCYGEGKITVLSARDGTGAPLSWQARSGYVLLEGEEGTVTYQVSLGELGKHGSQGFAGERSFLCSGSQALLLPLCLWSVAEEDHSQVGEITLSGLTAGNLVLTHPTWCDMYSLRKDGLYLGELTPTRLGAFTVYSQQPEALRERLSRIEQGLEELFGFCPQVILVLLEDQANLFGGSGREVIASSFDPDRERDWELLTHRLFHAAFDTACPEYEVHMPGCLWLYEALAVYHEELWQENPRQAGEEMLARLWTRCRDCLDIRPETFRVNPMEEENLTLAQQEFLHYTYAPLLLYDACNGEQEQVKALLQAFMTAALEWDSMEQEEQVALSAWPGDALPLLEGGSMDLSGLPALGAEEEEQICREYRQEINTWLKKGGEQPLESTNNSSFSK